MSLRVQCYQGAVVDLGPGGAPMEPAVSFTPESVELLRALEEAETALLGARALQLPTVVREVLQTASSLLGADCWAIWLTDPTGQLSLRQELSRFPEGRGVPGF